MRSDNGLIWGDGQGKIQAEEPHEDSQNSSEISILPYIPQTRQQRSGLLIDFLCLRGNSDGSDYLDLLMLGEKKFGVLLAHIPQPLQADESGVLPPLKVAVRERNAGKSAAVALRTLDAALSERLHDSVAIPAFYAIFNQQKHIVDFANAGHTPILVYRPGNKKLYRLSCEGNLLGVSPKAYQGLNGRFRSRVPNLKSETVKVRQHDLFLFYSEGLIQAKNTWGEPFGLARFLEFIRKHGHMQPTAFLRELQNALEQFTLGESLSRDATVIALKNMQQDSDRDFREGTAEVEEKFLTIDEEKQLWHTSEEHPELSIRELLGLLGGKFVRLGSERIHDYIVHGQPFLKNGYAELVRPRKRFESLQKHFQKEMLEAFPIRQLLYRKYEFRGNTDVIARALEHYQNGNFQESLIEFMKVRRAIAESESVFCFFGNLYLLLNMSIKARQEYIKALKRNPRCVHAYIALAYVSLLHEDYEGAINYLTTAIRLDSQLQHFERFLGRLVKGLEQQNGLCEWIS